jgi:SAM-dependent methyltransferase
MAKDQIRFEDGAAYERMMGTWSRLAGDVFLDWLAARPGLRWIDIGCGNGAFTELIVERCAPAEVQGIDPSEGQLAFARARPAGRMAELRQGDAMALPFSKDYFDAAVMALVIFFVPDPAKGCRRDGACYSPGRHGGSLCLGHAGRRIPSCPDSGRTTCGWHHASTSTECRCLPNGSVTRFMEGCRSRRD